MKSLVDSIYEDWRRYNKKNLPTSCNEFYVMWTAKISNEDGLVSWDNGMVKNSFYVDQYLLRVLSTNKIKTILKEEFEKKYPVNCSIEVPGIPKGHVAKIASMLRFIRLNL